MGSENQPVEKLMTSDIITVETGTSVQEAADILLEEGIGSLLVVDGDSLVGVLTSTDLVAIVSAGEVDADATVAAYMADDVVTIAPDETVDDAAVRMLNNAIQHLPVVDPDAGLVGMLSATDLTSYLTYRGSSGTE